MGLQYIGHEYLYKWEIVVQGEFDFSILMVLVFYMDLQVPLTNSISHVEHNKRGKLD